MKHNSFHFVTLTSLSLFGITAPRPENAAALLPLEELRHCVSIAEPGPRLACYDSVAGQRVEAPDARRVVSAMPKDGFGLGAAKRVPVEQTQSISAHVTRVEHSHTGNAVVSLDNGQLWTLDAGDPLLATGDEVTIRRGTFTSFLLTSRQGRTHHARRLR